MSNNIEHIVSLQNDKGAEAKDKTTDGLVSRLGKKRNVWESLKGTSTIKAVCSEGFLLLLGLLAIAMDPLFFYVPMIKNSSTCLGLDKKPMIVAIILRTLVDVLHDWLWWWRSGFRKAQKKAPKSIFDGRPRKPLPLMDRPQKRTKNLPKWLRKSCQSCVGNLLRFSKSRILMAIMASLPLPQVAVLVLYLKSHLKTWLKFGVTFQFIPRILRTYPTYVAASTSSDWHARIGAAFNLLYFVLTGHALGGFWYLRAVERKMDCMKKACRDHLGCSELSLYCESNNSIDNRFLSDICAAQPTSNATTPFDFGMYSEAIESNLIGSMNFIKRLSGSFWWGINNLSSSGQNIEVGDYLWDACFAIFICLLGLFLFALLIGNLQMYLQSISSTSKKLKEKKEKLHNWAPFFCLPRKLREEVCRCRRPNWLAESEVNLESLFNNIPPKLKQKLKPYFCENLFDKVEEFKKLEPLIKEELRKRATPVVFQAETYIYRNGHPIYKLVHIVQGKVSAYFEEEGLPPEELKMGDCLGKVLLQGILKSDSPWAEAPRAIRNIQAVTKVEAFALSMDDFVEIFSKHGHPVKAFRGDWAANVIASAYRRKWKASAERRKKSSQQ